MGLIEYSFDISDPENVKAIGVDFSNVKPISIAKRVKNYIVFKLPGGKCWAGIGLTPNAIPTRYLVAKILSEKANIVRVITFISFAPRDKDY